VDRVDSRLADPADDYRLYWRLRPSLPGNTKRMKPPLVADAARLIGRNHAIIWIPETPSPRAGYGPGDQRSQPRLAPP